MPPPPPINCYGFMEGVKGFRLIPRLSPSGHYRSCNGQKGGTSWQTVAACAADGTSPYPYLHFLSILHLKLFRFCRDLFFTYPRRLFPVYNLRLPSFSSN